MYDSALFIFLWHCTLYISLSTCFPPFIISSRDLFLFVSFHTTMKYHPFSGVHLISWSFVYGLVNLLSFSLLSLTCRLSVPLAVPNEKNKLLPRIRMLKKCFVFAMLHISYATNIFHFLFAFGTVWICQLRQLIFICFCIFMRGAFFILCYLISFDFRTEKVKDWQTKLY